jgi:transposase
LPAHLPRDHVIVPPPSSCPGCGGRLVKLGEDVTETREVVPRQWKVIQTVREKFNCQSCEKIAQPAAPFRVIARARASARLLARILYAKFGGQQPFNSQSETFAREGIELDVSTLADWVGACTASLAPLIHLIRRHVLAGERLHGDDTTAPVLAKDKTVICRIPRGGPAARCGPFATWTEEREGHDLEVVARPPRILPARCLGRRPNPRFQPRSTDCYHW